MYISRESLNNQKVQKKKMEELLNFWEKEGVPLPGFFHRMIEFNKPIIFRARHVASGKNEDYRFAELAHQNGMIPVWNQYLEDTFVSVSKPKLSLLYLRNLEDKRIKLTNPNKWEKKKISEIDISGLSLIEFHNDLWNDIPGEKYKCDLSPWLQKFGAAKDYYFAEMSIYTAFGVLAGDFHGEANPLSSKSSGKFTETIVEPAFQKVEKTFGVKPKIYQFSYEKGDELYKKI